MDYERRMYEDKMRLARCTRKALSLMNELGKGWFEHLDHEDRNAIFNLFHVAYGPEMQSATSAPSEESHTINAAGHAISFTDIGGPLKYAIMYMYVNDQPVKVDLLRELIDVCERERPSLRLV